MKCYNCGEEYKDSNNFCPYCGCKKRMQVCQACGHVIEDEGFKFCENCGSDNIRYMQEDKISLLQKALQGDSNAQYNLGYCYKKGQGVEQNYEEAVKWYRKSAEQGYASAQNNLGVCYENGQGVEQNYEEAVKWYRKSAEQGNDCAQNNLGICYKNGQGVEQNYEEAVKWYRKSAEQGYARAQCNLGYCYDMGEGVEQNYEEAVKWYRKSAEQGYARAQCNLGYCYEKGQGVEQNYEEAVKWYRKSAEQGYARAQCNLGYCYLYGQGVKKNYEEAVKWYRKSAEQGYANAQYELGYCYGGGLGVKKNYEEAVKWYRKSAEQGYANAQYKLGYYYESGLGGVKKNYEEAVKWYRKSAEQGNANAQYELGYYYESGLGGVKKNYEEAVKWYKKSAEQGYTRAEKNLENLLKEMNHVSSSTSTSYLNTNRYLFFDTETSGLPRNFNAPSSDIRNWTRLVQLSWIVTDNQGSKLKEGNYIIRPNGFTIPIEATRIHGISNQIAMLNGVEVEKAIKEFMDDVENCTLLIGHNVSFDKKIVGAELIRMGRKDTLDSKPSFCTMESTVNFCKIGNFLASEYKFPKLQELHQKLFGCNFDNGHNSSADVAATCKCFWELKKRGIINLSNILDNNVDKLNNVCKGKTFTVNGVSFEMIPVEGGTFTMGATPEQGSDAYDREKPAHQVTLSSYSIGKTEVTQALWKAVMRNNPSKFEGDDLPVNVSWDDCQKFIKKLNQLTGQNFRLPTEAEWEFAARGGNKSKGYKYAGSNNINEVAWYYSNSNSHTHPVATKLPNELGIYDMSGNVQEWVQDLYGSYATSEQTNLQGLKKYFFYFFYKHSHLHNPQGPSTGSYRVYRGGGWDNLAGSCRVSYRDGKLSCDRYSDLGFRLCL